ncbi:TonB-dependent receptor [Sphingomonas sp. KC8]|nr:TonB-dependent receptor [Sphingomonas sp. KC8]
MKTSRMTLLAGAALFALESAAHAQEAGIADIVVTAQKRGENLQRMPVAISAFTAKQLDLQGISETKDLSAIAPNVAVLGGTTNATASVVTIRGVPTASDESMGYDSPIGIYVDGVYLARSAASSFEVADIERIEVLRGPQGTLFGRNTTGGAVNFVTKRPTQDFNLALRAGAGNYDQRVLRGVLNTGTLAGIARSSISYLYKSRDGVVDNLLQPDRLDPGASTMHSARWALSLDLADNVTLTNIFDWSRIRSVAAFQQLVGVGNGNETDFPATLTVNGAVFPKVQPANVLGYLQAATSGEAECGSPVAQISRQRRSRVCNNSTGPSIDKVWGNMTRLEADLDGVTLRSTSAFRWWRNSLSANDLDGLGTVRGPAFSQDSLLNNMPMSVLDQIPGLTPDMRAYLASTAVPTTTQDLFEITDKRRHRQFSQEFEIVSPSGGAFEWVAGGFFFHEKGRELNPQHYAYVIDTDTIFTDANFGALAPALRLNNPARYRAMAVPSAIGYTASTRSYAVYGQATWRPGGVDDRLGVTLGLRQSWDSKTLAVFQNGVAPFAEEDLPRNRGSKKFRALTGNLSVDFRMSDDLNLYARIARGYRSGGFDARQNTAELPLTPFNSEKIWSYEAGAKAKLGNRIRINSAFFYNIYNDQFVTVPVPVGEGQSFGSIVVNAGKTRYYGFEFDGKALIADGFELDGAFGYVKADPVTYLAGDVAFQPRNVASIIKLNYAPKVTASMAASYRHEIGSNALLLRLGYAYTSSFHMFGNPLTAPFSDITKGDARGLVDAQIRLDQVNFAGGEFSVTLWAKNLTNKHYASRAVDFGQLGFSTVSFGDPRTLGLTVDMKF